MWDVASGAELSTEILRFQLACLRVAGPVLAGLCVALGLIVATVIANLVLTVSPSPPDTSGVP